MELASTILAIWCSQALTYLVRSSVDGTPKQETFDTRWLFSPGTQRRMGKWSIGLAWRSRKQLDVHSHTAVVFGQHCCANKPATDFDGVSPVEVKQNSKRPSKRAQRFINVGVRGKVTFLYSARIHSS